MEERVGHEQRTQAERALSAHHEAGRLDAVEFEERAGRIRAATTASELWAEFTDLPEPHPRPDVPPPAQAPWAWPPSGAPTRPYPGAQYPGPQYPGAQYPNQPQYPAQQYPPPYQHQYPGAGAYGGPPGVHPSHPGPAAYGPQGYDPSAPYGREPGSGMPYSDKQKIVAGLLQILIPFGIGRFYTGQAGLGVAQLLVTLLTFGFGAIWPFVDGIVILAGRPTDQRGLPLRP
ncbi:DUF1707 domain-containing protein [Pseudonocardia phyllosphaerae]|uniref:DUF1707 domain-containing protein n=1 Tax=Pseudonocardia phyllosphaerae TaxID=3390502 RepID=UPI0039797518